MRVATLPAPELMTMTFAASLAPLFWEKKFKIALLALATYAAMC